VRRPVIDALAYAGGCGCRDGPRLRSSGAQQDQVRKTHRSVLSDCLSDRLGYGGPGLLLHLLWVRSDLPDEGGELDRSRAIGTQRQRRRPRHALSSSRPELAPMRFRSCARSQSAAIVWCLLESKPARVAQPLSDLSRVRRTPQPDFRQHTSGIQAIRVQAHERPHGLNLGTHPEDNTPTSTADLQGFPGWG
jgi:hypothetical protein